MQKEAMMSEQNLLFPGKLAKTFAKRERRVFARHAANVDGFCQPVAADTAVEPEMGWPGEIIEISCGGMKLALERRFQPGTPLVIELPGTGNEPSRLIQVHVVHATAEPDGRWTHGCKLRVKLSDEDLQAFV